MTEPELAGYSPLGLASPAGRGWGQVRRGLDRFALFSDRAPRDRAESRGLGLAAEGPGHGALKRQCTLQSEDSATISGNRIAKALADQDAEGFLRIMGKVLDEQPSWWQPLEKYHLTHHPPAGVESALKASKGLVLSGERRPAAARTPPSPGEAGAGDLAAIQFVSEMYFCAEGEPHVALEVMRIGAMGRHVQACYSTRDGTARAGKIYRHARGVLSFEPMEVSKVITVELLDNSDWNSTLEFSVELLSEGLVCAVLGQDNVSTKVKVMDNDVFPSSKYGNLILSRMAGQVPCIGLFLEYVRLCMRERDIRTAFVKTVCADAVDNLYLALQAFIQMYLVDYVLDRSEHGRDLSFMQRQHRLILLAVLVLAPTALIHYLAYRKPFGLGSRSRMMLQKGVFGKYLNYTMMSRAELPDGHLIMAMVRDSQDLVQRGLKGLISLLQLVGEVLTICAIQLTAPFIFDRHFSVLAAIPVIVFPVLLLGFLALRNETTTRRLNDRDQRQDELIDYIDEATENFQLIADFDCRTLALDTCEQKIRAYDRARKAAKLVVVNNQQAPRWLAALCVALYMALGGRQVLRKELSLGMYLANLHLFHVMGTTYAKIYASCLAIQTVVPSLLNLTFLINQPTDLQQRSRLSRYQRTMEDAVGKMVQGTADPSVPLVDQLPLVVNNFRFSYVVGKFTKHMNFAGSLVLRQGDLCHLAGPHGEGKTTLLKILGKVILPDVAEDYSALGIEDAGFFISPHLRVLHVASEPLFLRASLFDNLVLGVDKDCVAAQRQRVHRICKRLGIKQQLLDLLEDPDDETWMDTLSHTEKTLFCFARALVMNPELLCIERHWMGFDESTAHRVIELLRENIAWRGLEEDPGSWESRRPRTVVMTFSHGRDIDPSDRVFHVSFAGGIREMSYADTSSLYRGNCD